MFALCQLGVLVSMPDMRPHFPLVCRTECPGAPQFVHYEIGLGSFILCAPRSDTYGSKLLVQLSA